MTARRRRLAALALGGAWLAARVGAEERAEPLRPLDALADDVRARLAAIAAAQPQAGAWADSVGRDLARHARERAALAGGRTARTLPAAAAADASLAGLRDAQEALMLACIEVLPRLRDPQAVSQLGAHLVDLSRHLTVTDLWIEAEAGDE